jgi:hypothetical protein
MCEHRVCEECERELSNRSYECPLCRAPRRDGAERVPDPPDAVVNFNAFDHFDSLDDFREHSSLASIVNASNDDALNILRQLVAMPHLTDERRGEVMRFVAEAYGIYIPPEHESPLQTFLNADDHLRQNLARETQTSMANALRAEQERRQERRWERVTPTVTVRGRGRSASSVLRVVRGVLHSSHQGALRMSVHAPPRQQSAGQGEGHDVLPEWYLPVQQRLVHVERVSNPNQNPVQFLAELAGDAGTGQFRVL